MVATMEPLIKKSAAGPAVPLNTAGPLSLAELRKYDVRHYTFKAIRRLKVPAAGSAQGTYVLLSLAPNTLVKSITTVVLAAFNASVTLTIGDADVDEFLASTDIAPQTKGTIAYSHLETVDAVNGKWYEAADTLDLTIGGADATQGELYVEIEYIELGRLGQSTIE